MFPAQRRGAAKSPTGRAPNSTLGAGVRVTARGVVLFGPVAVLVGLIVAGLVAGGLFLGGPVGSGLLAFAHPAPALAAEPSPILIDPLDPRADGEAAGFVGQPLLAAVAVLVLGLLAAMATAIYVRYTRRR